MGDLNSCQKFFWFKKRKTPESYLSEQAMLKTAPGYTAGLLLGSLLCVVFVNSLNDLSFLSLSLVWTAVDYKLEECVHYQQIRSHGSRGFRFMYSKSRMVSNHTCLIASTKLLCVLVCVILMFVTGVCQFSINEYYYYLVRGGYFHLQKTIIPLSQNVRWKSPPHNCRSTLWWKVSTMRWTISTFSSYSADSHWHQVLETCCSLHSGERLQSRSSCSYWRRDYTHRCRSLKQHSKQSRSFIIFNKMCTHIH